MQKHWPAGTIAKDGKAAAGGSALTPVLRSAGGRIAGVLDATLPHGRWADSLLCALRMYRAHHHLPRRIADPAATFNDYIYARMAADDWTPLERAAIDKQHAKLIAAAMCPGLRTSRTLRVFPASDEKGLAAARARLIRGSGNAEVAKPTHGSGAVLFLRRRPTPAEVETFCREASRSYYATSRESQYKGLERKIILEEDLSSGTGALTDYKFFCAHGEMLFCQIDVGRFVDHRRVLVTREFEPIRVRFTHDWPDQPPRRPENFESLVNTAERLARPFNFVRVDLYSVAGEVYFGEFTFAPEGGTGSISSAEFGRWVLSRIRNGNPQEDQP